VIVTSGLADPNLAHRIHLRITESLVSIAITQLVPGEIDTDARLWHPWLRINRVLRVMLHTHWSAEPWSQVRVEFKQALALTSEIRRAGVVQLTWGLRRVGLALICAERSLQTRRFQSSSAPRVLLSSQGQPRELARQRMVTQNYGERLRAGSSPALVF
jgi:hypothetical protein